MKIGPTLNFRELRDQVVIESTGRGASACKHAEGLGLRRSSRSSAILLFVGATGKSAQIPLYVWLPDAMAGPTPVSALIHAATMVTAGVYMVARLNFLFALSPGRDDRGRARRRAHRALRRDHRPLPVRHQEGARLLHRVASSASCSSASASAPTGPASSTC